VGALVFDAVDGCAWDGVLEPGGLEDGKGELVAGWSSVEGAEVNIYETCARYIVYLNML